MNDDNVGSGESIDTFTIDLGSDISSLTIDSLPGLSSDDIISMASTYTYTTTPTYTLNTSATSGTTWTTTTPYLTSTGMSNGITVTGDADIDGDLKVKGKSLSEWMERVERRLAILVPNPKKLEQYEALQKAYNHYKMLEALCDEQKDEDESK